MPTSPLPRQGRFGPPRFWYWPFWQLTRPWLPRAWRGGDEYDRVTYSLYIPLLGAFHYATDQIISWRCEDCQCLNSPQHWCCYRCGAGNPEDA